jgi:recombination protein RecT
MSGNIAKLNQLLATPSVKQKFVDALGKEAGSFLASLVEAYSNTGLKECDPGDVLREALKAAALKLPIVSSLGYAYLIPYKRGNRTIPQFQLGYRGLIQLALRSGQYRRIAVTEVFEGERITKKITGEIEKQGEPLSNEVVGLIGYFQLVNGFECWDAITKEEAEAHGKRFSKSFDNPSSPWQTDFWAMAKKTLLKRMLSKYGLISVEFVQALAQDRDPEQGEDEENFEYVDVDFSEVKEEGKDESRED